MTSPASALSALNMKCTNCQSAAHRIVTCFGTTSTLGRCGWMVIAPPIGTAVDDAALTMLGNSPSSGSNRDASARTAGRAVGTWAYTSKLYHRPVEASWGEYTVN